MEDNSKSMENYSNIEYVCGVLDTVTSLMTSVLQMDASMNKGEEAIILTLKECLLWAFLKQTNRFSAIILTPPAYIVSTAVLQVMNR